MYAYLTYRSRVTPLLIEVNTRYGWVANPFPTGTHTPQETPSFTRRDNITLQRTRLNDGCFPRRSVRAAELGRWAT